MESILKIDKIIDRDDYVESLSSHIDACTANGNRSVVFLHGETGVGKSSIMQKLRDQRVTEPPIIIVDTPPINLNTAPAQGQYISYIANAINTFYKSTAWSLDYFLNNSLSEHSNNMEIEKFLDSAHSIGSAIVAILGKSILQGRPTLDRLLFSTHLDDLLILREYIQFVIMSQEIILDITNAQNIDSMTATTLRESFDKIKLKILIFEYTTQSNDDSAMYMLANMYCSSDVVLIMEKVTPLPFEFALTLYSNDTLDIAEMEKFYRDVIKGNLYLLYKMNSVTDNILHITDPLKSIIAKLSYGAKLVLAIVCLHNGEIAKQTLDDIKSKFSNSYFISDTVFQEISCVSYIDPSENIILEHASVIDSFGLDIENYAVSSACKLLIEYYSKIVGHNNQSALLCLLRCYSIVSTDKVISLMAEFKDAILGTFSEDRAFSIIENAYNALAPSCNISLRLYIVYLCYSLGLYTGAYKLLNRIVPPFSCGYHALRCMLLNRTDRHEEAIQACQDLLVMAAPNSRFALIIQMIRMLSERSLNQNDYFKTFKIIFNNKRFTAYMEYGFLLRNAQIVFSYSDSLPYIRKSIAFFEDRGQNVFAAYSKMTLAVQLARLGQLEESADIIARIKPLLAPLTFERHILLCNEIAILLLQHDKSQNTMLMIEQALLTTTTIFDKLVLLTNYLSFYILNQVRGPLAESLIDRISYLAELEPDQKQRRTAYTNIYLYYKNVTEETKTSEFWKLKALSIDIKTDKLVDTFLGLTAPTEDLIFLASQSYCTCFITMWHFEFPFDDL